MKQFICVMVLTLVSFSVLSEGLYIGAMYGTSTLRYNAHNRVEALIDGDSQFRDIRTAINAVGGRIQLTDDMTSRFNKYVVGYRINRYFGIEAFSMRIAGFNVNLKANVDLSGASSNDFGLLGNTAGYTVNGDLKAGVDINGSADLSAYGLRFNGYIPVSVNFDIIMGIGVGYGRSNIISSTNITASGNYIIEGEYNGDILYSSGGVVSYDDVATNTSTRSGILPVVGIGAQYSFNDYVAITVGYDIYGIPTTNKSIAALSGGLLISF